MSAQPALLRRAALLLLLLVLASSWACVPARRGGGGGDDDEVLNNEEAPDNNAANNAATGEGACGTELEAAAVGFLNEARAEAGLSPVQCDARLLAAARAHSEDMATRNFFDHVNPDGEQPWDRLNRIGATGWTAVGENIAEGQRSAAEVHAAWMGSVGHRANILRPDFTHAGVGVYQDGGRIFWTQVFATF